MPNYSETFKDTYSPPPPLEREELGLLPDSKVLILLNKNRYYESISTITLYLLRTGSSPLAKGEAGREYADKATNSHIPKSGNAIIER